MVLGQWERYMAGSTLVAYSKEPILVSFMYAGLPYGEGLDCCGRKSLLSSVTWPLITSLCSATLSYKCACTGGAKWTQ